MHRATCDCDCVDCFAGHTTEILNRGGKVIALDQDLDAIDKVSKDLSIEVAKGNLEIIHTNFANVQGEDGKTFENLHPCDSQLNVQHNTSTHIYYLLLCHIIC